MNCKHCNKNCKNKNSLTQHEIRCKENPEAVKVVSNFTAYNEKIKNGEIRKEFSNQFTKAKKLGLPKPIFSEESRNKISLGWKGKKHTIESIEKLKSSMQRVVREKPESYSASNVNGRSKKILYNGSWMDSKWEFEFAKWCDDNKIGWIKNKKSFEYEWKGKRLYYPDFYIPSIDQYVEVKGYQREMDIEKWKAVPNLIVVKSKEINEIRKGTYKL
jgi:hypothetical protein